MIEFVLNQLMSNDLRNETYFMILLAPNKNMKNFGSRFLNGFISFYTSERLTWFEIGKRVKSETINSLNL